MSRRGSILLEVLAALVCTGLLTAGVMTLVVDSARTFRARQERIDATARVRAALLALAADLHGAGAGLEGARAVRLQGEAIPVLTLSGGLPYLVLPEEAAREVDAEPGGWLRTDDVSGLRVGDWVVGLGVGAVGGDPEADPPEELPVGPIVGLRRDRPRGPSGGSLRIGWAPAEAALVENGGGPRALLPVALREFGRRSGDFGLELRRRDLGGRWQTAVDGLTAVDVRPIEPTPGSDGAVPAGTPLTIEAVAVTGDGTEVASRTSVRTR